jgi:hypothetical protein
MSAVDFLTKPPIECPDTDAGDAASVWATCMIGVRTLWKNT